MLIGGVVLAVLAGVVVAASSVERVFFRPQSVVSTYFAALEDRDAEAARSLLVFVGADTGTGEALPDQALPDQALLDPAVLRSDGYTPPTDARIENVDTADATGGEQETAVVRASFALAGRRHTVAVDVVREEQSTAGLFHRWRIVGGLYPITISAPGLDSIVIAGRTVPFTRGTAGVTVAALPGDYRVTIADNPLFTATASVAHAGVDPATGESGTAGAVQIIPNVKPAAKTAADRQVRAYLDNCAKNTVLNPQGCPFYTFTFGDARNVRYKIDRYPVITLESDQFQTGRVRVLTITPGQYAVTWSDEFGSYRDDGTVNTSGVVSVSGGDLLFQPAD